MKKFNGKLKTMKQLELFPDPEEGLAGMIAHLRAAPPHEVYIRTTNYPRGVLDAECLTISIGPPRKPRKTYGLASTDALDWGLLAAEIMPLIDSWEGKVGPEGAVEHDRFAMRNFLDAALAAQAAR
jgi:hypothetical protein